MFSSNQQLKISGEIDDLKITIEYCLKRSGWLERFEDDLRPTFIITHDALYIGWDKDDKENSPNYWQYLQFPYSIDLLTTIIKDWLSTQECAEYGLDGSNRKGFIVDTVEHNDKDIKDAYYGIIKIKAYNCFYAK